MADQVGRIAVVTGGGRGLGRGVALGLAGAGDTVVAVARDTAQLAETQRLAADLPGSVTTIACDVADPAAVAALGDTVRARHGAPTILVNAIAPGPFPSKMMEKPLQEHGEQLLAASPLHRIGRGDDIASAAVYLASPASTYMTGAVIPLDGGLSTTVGIHF